MGLGLGLGLGLVLVLGEGEGEGDLPLGGALDGHRCHEQVRPEHVLVVDAHLVRVRVRIGLGLGLGLGPLVISEWEGPGTGSGLEMMAHSSRVAGELPPERPHGRNTTGAHVSGEGGDVRGKTLSTHAHIPLEQDLRLVAVGPHLICAATALDVRTCPRRGKAQTCE